MRHDTDKKRNWRLMMRIAVIIFLVGVSVLLYPVISNMIYEKNVHRQMDIFDQQIKDAMEDAINTEGSSVLFEKLYIELLRRNDELNKEKQKNLKDPFSYQQPAITLEEYGLKGNVIGFISIPKMKVELPILLGANDDNMRKGAVHLTETSYPIGGDNTNCVLAAHRGYSNAAMFRDIEELEEGDKIYIRNFRETLIYQVAELRIISPDDVKDLLIQPGRDLVTLITCHPYGHNYQRYVVYCQRVKTSETADSCSVIK